MNAQAPQPVGERSLWKHCTARVLRRRCPQCGEGALFRSRFRLADGCAHCGLVYRREPGAQSGSMYMCAAVTEVFAAALVLAIFFLTDWSPWVSIAVGAPIVLVFSFAFLPYSMALWVGTEYLTDVGNRESWARPRL